MHRRPRRLRTHLLGGFLAVALLAGCGGSDASTALPGELVAVDGGTALDLASAEQPLVVNLWATWCTPCRRELPDFDQVAAARSDVAVVGVNIGESADAAAGLVDELGLTFPQYLDPDGELQLALTVAALPATAFITTDGEVLEVHSGALTAAELDERIDHHFG